MRLNDLDFTISDYVVKKTANYINVRSESFSDLDDDYYNTFRDYIDTLAHGEVYCVVACDFPNAKMEVVSSSEMQERIAKQNAENSAEAAGQNNAEKEIPEEL